MWLSPSRVAVHSATEEKRQANMFTRATYHDLQSRAI
jgi:hypothetical protein